MAIADTTIILLPGLDGTAQLFRRFIQAAPPQLSLVPIPLPPEPLGYAELADGVTSLLPDGRLVLIAESFAGPLAVAITRRRAIAGLILCNSFVSAPRARALRWLAVPSVMNLPPPALLLRRYLLGDRADEALVREVAATIASVSPAILAHRIRSVLTVDQSDVFAHCGAPTLYLRGTDDRLVPDSSWRRMSRLRPMTMATVAGPHLLLQANPAAAWNAILPFIESLSPGPTSGK
jgi:pimeloyl-ACP methyl ester carboxylesterase